MKTFLILLVVTGMTLLGDALIKMASIDNNTIISKQFFAGLVFYALPAIGWFYLMKSHSLAEIAVLYSAVTIVALSVLGTVVFNERFDVRELAGILLALSAIAVMSHKSA